MESSSVVLIGMLIAFTIIASGMVFVAGRAVSQQSLGLPEWRIRGIEFYLALAGLIWWGCVVLSVAAIILHLYPFRPGLDNFMIEVMRGILLTQMLVVLGLVCLAGLMSGPFRGVKQ